MSGSAADGGDAGVHREGPPAPGEPARPEESVAEALARGRWWGRPLAETRWWFELQRLLVDPVLRGSGVPRGNGRAVVLVPGFLAGDQTLLVLAAWLRAMGHRPWLCGFVTNTDCALRGLERVERVVDRAHEETGRRVAVIGHSRGGHYARSIAALRPDAVSHAVSLGADLDRMFGISLPTLTAVDWARRGVHATGRAGGPACFTLDCACRFARGFTADFPTDAVRLTSVWSRGDGVVRWPGMLVPEAETVEVTGSHVGLVFNRKVYRALGDALVAPERVPVAA